jgi:hypothetical protein
MTESTDDSERVRQHVMKVLAQLRALKERQRAREKHDPGLGGAGEIDREEDTSGSIGGGEGPS